MLKIIKFLFNTLPPMEKIHSEIEPEDNRKLEIRKTFEFEAAHFLPKHPGLCHGHHGHSYKLAVSIMGERDKNTGMLIDFGDLKKIVNKVIIDKLDHKDLTKVFDYDTTAENMVYWIWDKLVEAGLNISKIELWETSGSCAILTKV